MDHSGSERLEKEKRRGRERWCRLFRTSSVGFGLEISAEELEREVDIFRAIKGRDPLEETPALRFLVYDKSKQGYWGYPDFGKQAIGVIDVQEKYDKSKPLKIDVDHSEGHAKYKEDGLNV